MAVAGARLNGHDASMPDYTLIGAALAGAVVGLILLRWAGARDTEGRTGSEPPPVTEASTPTGYTRRPVPTAGPILVAVGLALFGVGLAIGSSDGGLDARPLIPGGVVLAAALAAILRRRDTPPPPEAPGNVGPASVEGEDRA